MSTFDYGGLFTGFGGAVSSTATAAVCRTLSGLLVSTHPSSGGSVLYRLARVQDEDDLVSVSVPAHVHRQAVGVRALECVQLDVVQQQSMWVASAVRSQGPLLEPFLAAEHVPRPFPVSGKGPLFVMDVAFAEPTKYARSPGLFRQAQRVGKLSWVKKTTGEELPCLDVALNQRQWIEPNAPSPDMSMKMRLWQNHCEQLTPGVCTTNVATWKTLMSAHQVPFLAAVRVDADYGRPNDPTTLAVVSVRWHLAEYLAEAGIAISRERVRTLLPSAVMLKDDAEEDAAAEGGDVINMTHAGRIPPSSSPFHYYALTENRAHSAANLAKARLVLLFAVRSSKDPLLVLDDDEEEELVEVKKEKKAHKKKRVLKKRKAKEEEDDDKE